MKKILKRYTLEELLKKSWTRKAVFFGKKFTNRFNLYQLGLDKQLGDECINSNFIKCCKKADWNYAIAPNQLTVHLALQVFWQIGIDFLAKLIIEFILSIRHQNIPLGVETNVVVNYIHIFRETLNKSVVFIIVCDNYHKYLDSLSKLKARYCLHYQAKFKIFYLGSVIKFINSKFMRLKIPELPDSIV
ncbi:MAG: hypothetical protein ACR2LR_03845 [Hassallia sp.]